MSVSTFQFNPLTGNFDLTGAGGGGGGVASVTGTTDRIVISGTLANPIVDIASTYVGQNSITTLGTITTGTWNGTSVGSQYGGTGQSTYATGDILYASAANTLSKLPIGSNTEVLTIVAGIPSWEPSTGGGTVTSVSGVTDRTVITGTATDPIVDIAATYVGQTSLTTLGTITTGTWSATAIGATVGGTAQTSYTTGDILYASAANTLSKLPIGSNTEVLTIVAGVPSWEPSTGGGTVTSVSGTTDRVTISGTATDPIVDIASTYVGQSSITTLGTITTGTWNGTAIGSTFGGTGQSTYTTGDILYASATNVLSKRAAGPDTHILTMVGGVPTWAALSIPSTVGQTLTGNTGGALSPTSGNWNLLTAGSTVKFAGATSTQTLDFALDNLFMGTTAPSLSSGTSNVAYGFGALEDVTTGSENVAVGRGALANITTNSFATAVGHNAAVSSTTSETVAVGAFALQAASTGSEMAIGYRSLVACTTGLRNISIGSNTLEALTTGSGNTCLGSNAAQDLISGDDNTFIGKGVINNLTTGSNNIAIGSSAASAYTTSESSNIIIGNAGVVGESNTMRLGTQGTGAGQQSQTHIAGVINTVSGRVVKVTSPGAYPYTSLITDHVILVDTSSARTITPLANPVVGTLYYIKDSVGLAATNNITITPSGKNIDGAASYVINLNYGSVTIVYNGTEWSII